MKQYCIGMIIAAALLVGTAAAEEKPGMPATTTAAPGAAGGLQAAPATQPFLRLQAAAPEIDVKDTEGKIVTLSSLAAAPVVLQFGSITEPIFRLHTGEVEKMAKKYEGKAKFVIVYTTESHPSDGANPLDLNTVEGYSIAMPADAAERTKLAIQSTDLLSIKHQLMLVDDWNDATFKRYGSRPNMTFIIDANGRLAAAYPWMDPKKVEAALADVLAGNSVSAAHQGPIRTGIAEVALPKPGNGEAGGAAVAANLDALSLTETQRLAIFPALGEYFGNLRELREKFQAKSDDNQKQGDAANDLTAQLAKTKGSANKLKAVLQEQLTPEDYAKIMTALTQGPGRRFMAD